MLGNYCKTCDNLLYLQENQLICTFCDNQNSFTAQPDIVVIPDSRSKSKLILKESEASTINHICPKCNFNEAFIQVQQLRASDEGSTTFYVCKKCYHVDRHA